jgi:hypothetical protein
MKKIRVTPEFQGALRAAMENPFRFERTERFAMREVLAAAAGQGAVEDVFVETARAALDRQPVCRTATRAAAIHRAA